MTSLQRLQRPFGLGGLVLLLLCAVYGFFRPLVFFEGYLTAFVFWVEIALGSLALLLLQNLTGGLWGKVISRLLEAGMMMIPLCALFFIPIICGLPYLFSWVHPAGPELSHLVHEKSAYLNIRFYIVRNVFYFAVLGALAVWLRGLSLRRDGGDPAALSTVGTLSGPALIVFVLIMNFASIDWIMSLKPQWYSSMLVVEFVAEQAVVAMAGCIVLARCLADTEPMKSALSEKVIHDLGNLLLAFTCFWTYVTFAEYLITWTGNLPHEVSWFEDRSSPGWKAWAVVLVLVHFAIPLFCLILTAISKNLVRLSRVAALLIAAHFAQTVWWIEPAFGAQFHIAWTSLLLIPALGGIWLAVYMSALFAVPLLPRELRVLSRKQVPV